MLWQPVVPFNCHILYVYIRIFIFAYWHTYVTIHDASPAWYTNYSPHESATAKNKVLQLYLSTFNIFQHILSLSCWFWWGVGKLAPAQLPTCSINSLMLLKSCLGFLKSATLVLQQKSRFTDGFFFRVSRLLLLFVVPLKFLLKEGSLPTWRGAEEFFPTWHSTWMYMAHFRVKSCVKTKDFLDCQQKNLSTS